MLKCSNTRANAAQKAQKIQNIDVICSLCTKKKYHAANVQLLQVNFHIGKSVFWPPLIKKNMYFFKINQKRMGEGYDHIPLVLNHPTRRRRFNASVIRIHKYTPRFGLLHRNLDEPRG